MTYYVSVPEFFCGTDLVSPSREGFRYKLCRKIGISPRNMRVWKSFRPAAQYVMASIVIAGHANMVKTLHWFWDDEKTLGKGHYNEMLKFRPISFDADRNGHKNSFKADRVAVHESSVGV